MEKLQRLEVRLIKKGSNFAASLLSIGVHTFADYKHRHIATSTACVSFFAMLSTFPLLAFMVYIVGVLIGNNQTSHSAPIVLKILREYVPAMQNWIEKGLFDVIQNNAVSNWVNAIVLGWSGLRLFTAVQTTMDHLPPHTHETDRAHITQILLALSTFFIFTLLTVTVVFCQLAAKDTKIPFWMQGLPFELQDAIYFGAHTGLLLLTVSVLSVASLYKLLLPCPLRMTSALLGGALFTGLLFLSKSLYWVYLHYNRDSIQSTYGIFSNLVMTMLWVHFIVNCLVYSCLFAIHFDQSNESDHQHTEHKQDSDHKAAA